MNGNTNKQNKAETDFSALVDMVLDSVRVPSSSRSKEEAWLLLVQNISKQSNEIEEKKSKNLGWKISVVAASILLILTFSYLKYSTVSLNTSRGQFLSYSLPDGSEVLLNACSKINFSRYWFLNPREIILEGEAFFRVKKGKTFIVKGHAGHRVEVVGTQFNVNSRDSIFSVTCFEGTVKVTHRLGKSIMLIKGETSTIKGTEFTFKKLNQISSIPAWTNGEFYFESIPLRDVFDELMRQYNISIISRNFNPSERFYTGYFTNKNLRQALDWITMPMSLQYSFINDTTIQIFPAE
ncbi:MAG: FecR family protein [Bacteroidales bacterium]|nr:FecR family protein [Bacteroidales bacterium]